MTLSLFLDATWLGAIGLIYEEETNNLLTNNLFIFVIFLPIFFYNIVFVQPLTIVILHFLTYNVCDIVFICSNNYCDIVFVH